VLAVGAQGRRAQATPATQQNQPDCAVDARRHQSDRKPDTEIFERLRLQQPSYRGNSYPDSRHDDQDALQSAGEVLCLGVAVSMLLIGWPCGRSQCQKSPYCRDRKSCGCGGGVVPENNRISTFFGARTSDASTWSTPFAF
jgi:hypothetical protein